MSKNIHFTGQPLFSQILSLIDKQEIKSFSHKGGYDKYVKKFDGYSHFVVMLYGVLMRYDSLREIVIGMLSEAGKLQHLGINYMVKRSTLSEANNRRSSEFFSKIYFSLYQKHKTVLADSQSTRSWEHLLHIMDSTTISLFSNVLKGVGRNPKHGKKKGGIKVHTVMRADEGLPYDVHFTSAATHDHVMLRKLKLTNGAFLAMDRAYIDYKVFEKFTQDGVFYVTKMKKNQRFETQQSCYRVNEKGLVVLNDAKVIFSKDDIKHTSRKIEYWEQNKKQSSVLLTNNFELDPDEIIEIYKRRWQIELLFKQLKQNFPLKYFYGESVNAIQTQILVTLITNLLLTVIKKKVKRDWSFSNLVTMVRQTLMYYINLYSFCENPEKAWLDIIQEREKSPPMPSLFD
ncbi:transposase [Flavobacterium sp. L1I52]|uniref:Transposase n=1 Tax=Flavobacterium pokkalii TaxID=1940408 RepID=A0ABR7UXI3_9FLAO|nr:IS4 family transposase [Flavobacterium pokkalii]MBD0726708.1 transposase [Flavobacterium pokkalii]